MISTSSRLHAALASFVSSIVLAACGPSLGDPPTPTGAREERVVTPAEDELECPESPLDGFVAPSHLLALDGVGDCEVETEPFCFRLSAPLREVARTRDPLLALARAAEAFDAHTRSRNVEDLELALAHADLAVSGGESYRAFAARAPRASDIPTSASEPAIDAAIERAYAVAWALHGPPSHRGDARGDLGWVAVSPEDDLPTRPVNVRSSEHPQGDLIVTVPLADGSTREVRTRATIASTLASATDGVVPSTLTGSIPPEPGLDVPETGDVILYVPGHSSRAEEGATLTAHLLAEHRAHDRDLTVIAFDLPSAGYAEHLDPDEILATDASDEALLRFHDAFIDAFVDQLEAIRPGVEERIVAVMGGSLGGNLALRLAERSEGRAWPASIVAWSPVSIDFSWTRARWPLAAGDGEMVDIVKHEAVRLSRDASRAAEDDDAREDYFADGLSSVGKQAEYWYRDDWTPCRERYVGAGLTQLGEIYDPRFRRWHYRIAYEQLVFSHLEVDGDGVRPYERISVPLLLVAGEKDNSVPMQTYFFVERLAPHLTAPGVTLFLEDTGHAMHAERPLLLAREIAAFLPGAP